ncbi:MAG: hypothetical protein ABIZ52_05150 [Candidatus Limnocylindrales bacterium]
MTRRLVLALTFALAAQAMLVAGALAVRDPQAKPVKPGPSRGYDISYPQCVGAYPSNPSFAIVGVNGGRVDRVNPCLASQIAWGGGTAAELYANTGNPGPALSSQWPVGQTTPRVCEAANPDTADCAFDYGWNAAKYSFDTATAAYQQLGIATSPALTAWWLDVETSNSWRSDNLALNVAALEGEVAYLRDIAGVTRLGFYSTTYQWGLITGGTTVFAAYPSWGAGSSSERAARSLCNSTTTSFTGGPLVLVQYPYSGFDADLRC